MERATAKARAERSVKRPARSRATPTMRANSEWLPRYIPATKAVRAR